MLACLAFPRQEHKTETGGGGDGTGLPSYFPSYLRLNVLVNLIIDTQQSPERSFALTVSTIQRKDAALVFNKP